MAITDYIFFICSFLAVLLSLYVVFSNDAVKSVLGLVGVFFLTAINWMLLQAEFLAVILVLVYIGAVMVLFLFVVMMVQDSSIREEKNNFFTEAVIALISVTILAYGYRNELSGFQLINQTNYFSLHDLSSMLFSQYLVPFEIAGLVLLVSIVSAVSLTLQGPRDRKSQDEDFQIETNKTNRLKMIRDMKP